MHPHSFSLLPLFLSPPTSLNLQTKPEKLPEDMKSFSLYSVFLLCSFLLLLNNNNKCVCVGLSFHEDGGVSGGSTGTVGRLVKKEDRLPVVATEFGQISAVDVDDGSSETGKRRGRHYNNYHVQFITLEPNSLFLPVLLHADMVFYVQTGSGKLSWTDSDELTKVSLQRGDVYRLKSGTLFYVHSSLEPERPRLRIIAIFTNPEEEQLQGPLIGPYSSINDLVRGFDKDILQAAFQVPEEVVEELTSATDTPAIVHAETKRKNFWQQQEKLLINVYLGIQRYGNRVDENKKKHTKTFNFFKEDPDFKNCNGWSTVVTKHDLHALHGSQIGVFMVNLTKGSMMGPHWNPTATEVSIVLEGEGMVRVVCPSALTNKECKNSRFRVEEGDVFTVPRFHPVAQTSFNNGSLVFMGFSTTTKKNHPQFLAGKASVLQTLSKPILGVSFNVSNTTIDQLLAAQEEAIILDCTSCAEEQEVRMEDEIEKERQEEEERRREEEEKRKREEEEERKKREEEEEQKRQEEEEEKRKKEEEEERRRKEEEEEERRREEEEQRRHEEEEQRRREEEEAEQRRQEEEEEKRQREEEEEQRKREKEERKREEDEEKEREAQEKEQKRREEEEKRREEEEERQREEEEQRRQEEEERQREEEEQRQREEEEQRRQEEEERQREEEKERQREEEEQRRREKEEKRRQREEEEQRRQEEKERQREEERQRRQEEEERQREEEEEIEQEEQQRRQEEERRRQEEEEKRRREESETEEETEQEIARREEEERREQERQAEEAARERREREESRQEEEEEQEQQRRQEAARPEEERRRREESEIEEETEQEIARREEEERRGWERRAEEAARMRREGEGSGGGSRGEGRRRFLRLTT
ncbi:vicilin-like seed storage protein At2g18540 [Spinacia oleracea]|uniref:Vicilin-like seed storage protein At2g18540 n=1 Tax=Spinacia oleracea TaxID=3562 RepID=A0A9R0JHA1_SPIOL|nr:vicilin-like seed storage protein At2g18540 [Spinacia oleracea]